MCKRCTQVKLSVFISCNSLNHFISEANIVLSPHTVCLRALVAFYSQITDNIRCSVHFKIIYY